MKEKTWELRKQKVMILYFNLSNLISQFKFNNSLIFNNLKFKSFTSIDFSTKITNF